MSYYNLLNNNLIPDLSNIIIDYLLPTLEDCKHNKNKLLKQLNIVINKYEYIYGADWDENIMYLTRMLKYTKYEKVYISRLQRYTISLFKIINLKHNQSYIV